MIQYNRDIDVVILCGGLGKRLLTVVNDRPKSMVKINERPFLEILIDYISDFGFKRFILSVGHMADKIVNYFPNRSDLEIVFSEEKRPLGTGGAIKKAKRFIKSDPFLVTNGDSFCKLNLHKFLNFHNRKNALASVVLTKNSKNKECGFIKLKSSNRIINFSEKSKFSKNSFINAGIYLFQKEFFSFFPKKGIFSLEYDLFPRLINKRFYGYKTNNILLDIGTPEGLKQARSYLKGLNDEKI